MPAHGDCILKLAASGGHSLENFLETEFGFLVGPPARLPAVERVLIFVRRRTILLSHIGSRAFVDSPPKPTPSLECEVGGGKCTTESHTLRTVPNHKFVSRESSKFSNKISRTRAFPRCERGAVSTKKKPGWTGRARSQRSPESTVRVLLPAGARLRAEPGACPRVNA